MNKARKHDIEVSRNNLRVVKDNITTIRKDELGDFVDLSCTMQSYTLRLKSEQAIGSLTDVIAHINKAIDKLDNIP